MESAKAEFISVNRFGEIFDVKPARVREYIADGSLRAIRLKGTLRIPIAEIARVKQFGLEAKSEAASEIAA